MRSDPCPQCRQYQAVEQAACPDCLAKFAALRIVPTDHQVRYMYGSKTVTKRAADLGPLKAIRAKCVDCSGGSPTVATECVILDCPLWHYRLGHRPKYVKGVFPPGIDSGAVEGHLRGTLAAPQPPCDPDQDDHPGDAEGPRSAK